MRKATFRWYALSLAVLLLAAAAPVAAQTADSYNTYYFSSDGRTLYATVYTDGQMTNGSSYQHDYVAYSSIQGPPGSPNAVGGGTYQSGYVSASGLHSVQSSVDISTLIPGLYYVLNEGSAYCTFVGTFSPFYDTGAGRTLLIDAPVINAGGVVNGQTGNADFAIDTSGTLSIYGLWLTASGVSTPSISTDDANISLSIVAGQSFPTEDQQVNVSYTIGPNARPGAHNLYIRTSYGTSNPGAFTVGDATPVISSISPNVWDAGITTPFILTGKGFGTSPSLSVSGTGIAGSSVTSSSDTQIVATVTIVGSAPSGVATVVVTSNGYNGSGFVPETSGQSNKGSVVAQVVSPIFSLSPSSLNVSTGDTNKQITVSSSPPVLMSGSYSIGLYSNVNGSCPANLGIGNIGGTGTASSTVAATKFPCSGIFNVLGAVNSKTSANSIQVIVPPQQLVSMLFGESGGGYGSAVDQELGLSVQHRFQYAGQPSVFGGVATWQAAITTQQYNGYNPAVTTGVEPSLDNAVIVFSGASKVNIQNAPCFFSPTPTGWAAIQAALNSGTTTSPTGIQYDPLCFGSNRQILVQSSMPPNLNRSGAPAFVFEQSRAASSPAVIQIP